MGSRGAARTVTASAVPVDILSTSDLTRQGVFNLQEQLRTVVPSFNVNTQPISDASTVVRPAMLRNLAPDHTLVLVNGKRRRRAVQTRAALEEFGIVVCPHGLGQRAAVGDAVAMGLVAAEFMPASRAASEARAVADWIIREARCRKRRT